MAFPNSFPFVRSDELRKFFPYVRKLFSYVPEINDILMLFLGFLQLELNRCAQGSAFTLKVYTEEN